MKRVKFKKTMAISLAVAMLLSFQTMLVFASDDNDDQATIQNSQQTEQKETVDKTPCKIAFSMLSARCFHIFFKNPL